MTKDEAIKYAKEQLEIFGGKHADFIKLAIKLLEQDDNKKLLEIKQINDNKKEEIRKDRQNMINCEKYKDDLMKIRGRFAFNKHTKKIVKCDKNIACVDCVFNSGCFESDKIKWLYEEYKEPILSDDELELIKVLGKVNGINYKYVAKDTCGVIGLFETKPCVNKLGNYYSEHGYTYVDIASEDKISFLPNITHKDGLYDIENKCFIKEEGDN